MEKGPTKQMQKYFKLVFCADAFTSVELWFHSLLIISY